MSAFIVDRDHIKYLVKAALSPRIQGHYGFSYYHNEKRVHLERFNSEEQAAEIANMLWRENIRSVSARYPNESSATLPGPRDCEFVIEASELSGCYSVPDPAQLFKSCDCYEYQTCETDDWQKTEAMAFINALRSAAWHSLPGYEDAEWGAPQTVCKARAKAA